MAGIAGSNCCSRCGDSVEQLGGDVAATVTAMTTAHTGGRAGEFGQRTVGKVLLRKKEV
jgi:hypothetical protein